MVVANNFLKKGFALYVSQFGEQITKLHFVLALHEANSKAHCHTSC